MVLASDRFNDSNMHHGVTTSNSVQCTVSDLALYRLPTSVRMESVDFENLILQCVKNNLNGRNENADYDLTRDLIRDTFGLNVTLKTGITNCSNESGDEQCIHKQDCQFVVCLEPNRLAWTVLRSPVNLSGGKFDFARHCCSYMQTCFSEIKLCYVNIQLPNIVIWLLSSIPRKIVKNETLTARCDTQPTSPSKKKTLFALVWQCFRENDVVSLRQVYKNLRFSKKSKSAESGVSGSKLVTSNEPDMNCSNMKHLESDMHSARVHNCPDNRITGKSFKAPIKVAHHILSRQRQPAKLIHENILFACPTPTTHTATLELKSDLANLSHNKKGYLVRSFPNAPESEFDTTQISNYLSHNCKSIKSSTKNRTRSRSVESPRHRFRLVYKPICDDIEILIPSSNNNKRDLLRRNGCVKENNKDGKSSKDYLDLLNSEGSSISDESTSGEFAVPSSLVYDYYKLNSESPSKSAAPIVIKSALKKSSSYFEGQNKNTRLLRGGFFSNSCILGDRSKVGIENRKATTNSRQCITYAKKNVTFSAYATIQVVDN